MTLIIVETSWEEPISDEEFDAQAGCVCVFEARDAEAVRQAYRLSGVKFERVWAAEQILDEDDDE